MDFWDSGKGMITIAAIIIGGLLGTIFLGALGAAEWNKHNAPIAYAQCAKACGAAGVHRADPDFKCECNETRRYEGHPAIDLNLNRVP